MTFKTLIFFFMHLLGGRMIEYKSSCIYRDSPISTTI